MFLSVWKNALLKNEHAYIGTDRKLSGKKSKRCERAFIKHGPEEIDLVIATEETMIAATREVMKFGKATPRYQICVQPLTLCDQ